MIQFETTIFGGLPVTVEARIEGPDREVGIMDSYVEIEGIFTARTRKRDRKVVYRQIPESWWKRLEKQGLEQIEEEAYQHA